MKKLIILGIITLFLASRKKEQILYDTERKYTLDGITLDGIQPPIKLLKNVSGPLLPGKKKVSYRHMAMYR